MLVIIQVLIEKVMGIGGQALVTFIDYSKAFDSISHVQLFDIMLELGFPEHIVALLQSLYIDQTAVIRWNGSTTETFPISKGVRQGCILSPHLFSLYTESVMREAEIQDLGYNIGGRNISNARYADDTALIAQSPMEMQQLLDKVNAAGAQRLLKLNVKKTKLMIIGDVPDDITIRVNNDPVEKVKQFKYLGSLKSTDGDCSKDVNARIAMAKRRMCELTTLWKDRSIPVALKMRLVKTLVWTVMSYGAEAWTLKARDERKITSMEMWLWRRMLRISWMEKRTDNSILQELEIKRELLGHVRKRKLSYYGHLCRDHGCQITKTVVEGYVEGRRRRGRPRKQYIDNIKQWTQLTTSQCVRAAEDRSRWKQLISQAMVADDHTWSAEKKKKKIPKVTRLPVWWELTQLLALHRTTPDRNPELRPFQGVWWGYRMGGGVSASTLSGENRGLHVVRGPCSFDDMKTVEACTSSGGRVRSKTWKSLMPACRQGAVFVRRPENRWGLHDVRGRVRSATWKPLRPARRQGAVFVRRPENRWSLHVDRGPCLFDYL